jgi:hypothetical protein
MAWYSADLIVGGQSKNRVCELHDGREAAGGWNQPSK